MKKTRDFLKLFLPILVVLGIVYISTWYIENTIYQIGILIILSILLTSILANINKPKDVDSNNEKDNKFNNEIRNNLKTQVEISTEIYNTCEELGFLATESLSSSQEVAASVDLADNNATEQSQMLRHTNDLANKVQMAMEKIGSDIIEKTQFIFNSITSAQKGIEKFNHVENRIKNSMDMVVNTSEKVIELKQYSDEVVSLIDLINTISSQTKMLSLNAAIEAARAGEHGRGFSIVAMEVGKLADETDNVSKRIEEVIHRLMEEILSISQSMENEVKYMEENYTVVEETNKDFIKIVEILNTSMDSLESIKDITGENNSLIEEINSNVQSISGFSEQTSAQMVRTAEQTLEQYRRSEELNNMVDKIRNNVYKMQQFVVGKVMEEKMLKQAYEVKEYFINNQNINDNMINEIIEKTGVDAIYITNSQGVVEYTNEKSAMGLNLYEADQTFLDFKKKGLEYIVTPIKKRIEDGKLFKFLTVTDERGRLYEVGLSLDSMIKNI